MSFKVGTEVTSIDWGHGVVIEIQDDPYDSHPIKVKFHSGLVVCFKLDGSYWCSVKDDEADIFPLQKLGN